MWEMSYECLLCKPRGLEKTLFRRFCFVHEFDYGTEKICLWLAKVLVVILKQSNKA